MQRVFISQRLIEGCTDAFGDELLVMQRDRDDPIAIEELVQSVRGCQALICLLTDRIPAELFDQAPQLRIVANIAVGYDNVDVAAATATGVAVTNTPGVLTEATADFTFALLLSCARKLVQADAYVRAGQWKRWGMDLFLGQELRGRTLGILGCGRIGRAVARRAAGFGLKCIYHNRLPLEAEVEQRYSLRWVDFKSLLMSSDFLSVHVPYSPATHHLLDKKAFAQMKPGAVLLNTARGAVVDELALVAALQQGSLGGAGLDVFESEPSVHPELLSMSQVVLAPHLGSATTETRRRMCEMAVAEVRTLFAGHRPKNLVNPEVWDTWR